MEYTAQNISANYNSNQNIWFSNTIKDVSYPEGNSDLTYKIDSKSFWYNHRNSFILKCLEQLNVKGFIYDIGGGNGVVSMHLQDNGYSTVLIEPSLNAVKNAKNRGVINVVCSTIDHLTIEPKSFDNIALLDVLEHIDDDKAYLSKLSQIIRENGYLILSVPAYSFLWSNLDESVGHYRRYTLKSLSQLIIKEGFEIELKSYLFSPLLIPVLLKRRLSYLFSKKNTYKTTVKENEHVIKNKIIRFILTSLLNFELLFFNVFKIIPFGTSCFIIAKKKNS